MAVSEIFNRVEETIREAKSQGLDDVEQIIGRVRNLEKRIVAELESHPAEVDAVVEEGAALEPTIFEEIDKATSNADVAEIAKKLGVEIPDDVKAAWTIGEEEVAKVADKKAALTKIATEQAGAAAGTATE